MITYLHARMYFNLFLIALFIRLLQWIPKLKMTRTALKLVDYFQSKRKCQTRKELASFIYGGSRGTLGQACKGNKELSSYLGSLCLIETKKIFPRYSGMKYSNNIMILAKDFNSVV